ncbi:MAG TPA: TolC family protein [Longimicrobiales bacterium]|nr:TolC family protein [Longimicrobiales bacterium]
MLLVLAALVLSAGRTAAQQARTVTLEEAIRLAVERDPLAVAADVAVSNARADQLVARGALLPSLNLNTFWANSSNERFDQATGRLVSESYTAQLQGGWDIFAGGRRFANLRSTSASLAAADAQFRSQRYNTILRTTQLFYAAAAASDLVRVSEQRLERARQQLTAANTRLELGTVTRSDVLRAELELGNAELALLEVEADLRRSGLELGRQIGVEQMVAAAPAALPDSAPPLAPTEQLIVEATRASPAVRAAESTSRARRAERLAAWTPYLPTVRLSGGYDWFSFDWPPNQRSWSMRVTASLPVFNNFQRESALQRAGAAERLAEAREQDLRLQAHVLVESGVADIAAAERRVQIADRAVQLAREDLRVIEERYGLGHATIIELQTSQVALSDAEVAAVTSRQTLGTAIAQLEAVLGRTINEE